MQKIYQRIPAKIKEVFSACDAMYTEIGQATDSRIYYSAQSNQTFQARFNELFSLCKLENTKYKVLMQPYWLKPDVILNVGNFWIGDRFVKQSGGYLVKDEIAIIVNIVNQIKDDYCGNDLESHLHESIKKIAYQQYLDGHYPSAVFTAFVEINDRLKKMYKKHKGVELDGKDLFAKVFSSDATTVLLKVADWSEESGRNEQEGYRFLFMGSCLAIRNPKAHANLTLTQDEAYDRLILASLLMKRIDKAIAFTGITE